MDSNVPEKTEQIRRVDHLPLITVAMPVYNAGKFLRPAVLSIVNQTFIDWELLIIDDNSTDGSLEDITDICDNRIRILRDGINKGISARLNEAIDLARGHYFARMDSDDISYSDRLARQVDTLKANSSLDLVGVRSIAISDTNEVIGVLPYAFTHEELCIRPWWGFYLAHPTWMGKIEWFRFYRYAIPALCSSEDQEMLLRSHSFSHFATLPDILFAYRVHKKVNWRRLVRMRSDIIKFQIRYFIGTSKKHFILLAIIIFFARVAKDLIFMFLQPERRFIFGHYRNSNITKNELLRWENVLKNLSLLYTNKIPSDNKK